jgi:glycosyltransferase involved in cell wall biosynthesis
MDIPVRHHADGHMKAGVFIPTYNRPDLLRSCVAQWLLQSRPPDVICIHQNGSKDAYQWCIEDLSDRCEIIWIHTPEKIPQHQWYIPPLEALIVKECTHFFWSDDDDLYSSAHISTCLAELSFADFRVAEFCSVLYVKERRYDYQPSVRFDVHGPGGMSSSMAFNRRFAKALVEDLTADREYFYSDNVLALVTMPKFSVYRSNKNTCTYKCHSGTVSSCHWLQERLPDK